MAHYRYRGRNKQGDVIEGYLDAPNEKIVIQHLSRISITPVTIKVSPKDPWVQWARWLPMLRPSLGDLTFFAQQMHSLLKAGVPINRALTIVIDSSSHHTLVNALTNILLDLESGYGLARCFQKQAWIFPDFFTSLINIGEQTGQLDEMFAQMVTYLQTERVTQKRVRNATRYPLFVLIVIVFALFIINFVVVPSFQQFFESFGAELPLATQWLMTLSRWSLQGWPYLLLGVVGIGGLYVYANDQASSRYRLDAMKLKIPLLGWILHRALMARFVKALALAHQSGLPLLDAIQLVGQSMENTYLSHKILEMRHGLERGEKLSQTARQAGIFSELVIHMLQVSEETGNIETNLFEIARFYEADVDYDIQRLNELLEPALIGIIAVMVLILALGVFLPLWDLSDVAIHRIELG